MDETFTLETMETALRDAGLEAGDRVFIHSNLRAIASYRLLAKLPNAGMDLILAAFRNVLTEEGVMGFPTFTATFVNRSEGPTGREWDPKETPSRVGSLTDHAWRQAGFHRSEHPTHSVAMWGKGAEQFVQGHGNHTFGQETPWGTMWREGFKQMFLGTWFNTCTAIHVTEDWLGLPFMAPELPVWLKDGDGRKEGTVTGSPWGNRDFYKKWGGKVVNRLWVEDRHLFRAVTHGRCTILTTSYRDLVSTIIDYHYDDPLILLNDPEKDPFAAKYAEATVAVMEG